MFGFERFFKMLERDDETARREDRQWNFISRGWLCILSAAARTEHKLEQKQTNYESFFHQK
jgi:hypothetical protein